MPNIPLTPELEEAVKRKVCSGLYNNASEVIREALRQSLTREQENQWLAREAASLGVGIYRKSTMVGQILALFRLIKVFRRSSDIAYFR